MSFTATVKAHLASVWDGIWDFLCCHYIVILVTLSFIQVFCFFKASNRSFALKAGKVISFALWDTLMVNGL